MVAAGGSGHGFKFAPLLGDLIADAFEGAWSAVSPGASPVAAPRSGKSRRATVGDHSRIVSQDPVEMGAAVRRGDGIHRASAFSTRGTRVARAKTAAIWRGPADAEEGRMASLRLSAILACMTAAACGSSAGSASSTGAQPAARTGRLGAA